MEKLGLNDIRSKFLRFFESKGHLILPSFSLIPQNDKSLLLINAGMAPLKPYFTGQEVPPRKRVATCQKCIRTPDIERVGKTARHATFFEMLGNFSFGDYFKKEAIPWAWEFVTQELKLPIERLWVSIYQDDDEAFDIWHRDVGVPVERIVRMGKEDNFWEIGVGPCGPCSEIYFDRGEDKGCGRPDCGVGCDCDRFVEFWNLVFTQFYRNEDGTYDRLSHPNIDTGMGLERISAIMQGVDSIFEIDVMRSILEQVSAIVGVLYGTSHEKDVSLRVITDHARSATFMVSDGIMPSNEGRGYVLRRIIRRAVRHGRLLGIKQAFLYEIVRKVIDIFEGAYPELGQRRDFILNVVKVEEERFRQTLDQGMQRLEDMMASMEAQGEKVFDGYEAFRLYDTYGFPIDLTKEILAEKGMIIDMETFESKMHEQRQRARLARKQTNYMGTEGDDIYAELPANVVSQFTGYQRLEDYGVVLALIVEGELRSMASAGQDVEIILDRTPFYAQSGGQVGDKGLLQHDKVKIEIYDCKKAIGGRIVHCGRILEGSVVISDRLHAAVNIEQRMATARNHTATHLLHKALRDILGTHVQQAGSLVAPDRLRFDFSHFAAVTPDELNKIEQEVNRHILADLQIEIKEMPLEEARKLGAMALFDEKYGERVRVVSIGDYSRELCGGTHLERTGQAGLFKILSESSVAAGVRRIEAITGFEVIEHIKRQQQTLDALALTLKTTPADLHHRAEALLREVKELKQQLQDARMQKAVVSIEDIMASARNINGLQLVIYRLDDTDMPSMRKTLDAVKDRLSSGVAVLAGVYDGKVNIVVGATKPAVQKGIHAGQLVKQLASLAGGSGGGRPDMGQAGAKDVSSIERLLVEAEKMVAAQVKGE